MLFCFIGFLVPLSYVIQMVLLVPFRIMRSLFSFPFSTWLPFWLCEDSRHKPLSHTPVSPIYRTHTHTCTVIVDNFTQMLKDMYWEQFFFFFLFASLQNARPTNTINDGTNTRWYLRRIGSVRRTFIKQIHLYSIGSGKWLEHFFSANWVIRKSACITYFRRNVIYCTYTLLLLICVWWPSIYMCATGPVCGISIYNIHFAPIKYTCMHTHNDEIYSWEWSEMKWSEVK